jgi:DNA-binding NarL/FixJ family response regulator
LIPIRVLLAEMPRMLIDIIKDITASHEEIDVIGEVADLNDLTRTAIRTRADVIVVGDAVGGSQDDYHELLRRRPALKILAITADGRRGFLHELQPMVVPLGELSPRSLIDAILGRIVLRRNKAG